MSNLKGLRSMLTPQEISGKSFVKAVFGGYDMSVVDDFLETLTADYTTLHKENAALKSKIKVLVDKVEEYRATDDAMRMALLTAQKLGDEITAEARRKSDMLLQKTEADVRERLQDIKNKYAEEENKLKAVREETKKFIAVSQEIIRQHTQYLSKLEEVTQVELEYTYEAPVDQDAEPEAPVEPPVAELPEAQSAREDEITETARQIDDALVTITDGDNDGDADPFAKLFKGEDTAKLFKPRKELESAEVDEPTSPRPKFDFNNLKFGSNYSGD